MFCNSCNSGWLWIIIILILLFAAGGNGWGGCGCGQQRLRLRLQLRSIRTIRAGLYMSPVSLMMEKISSFFSCFSRSAPSFSQSIRRQP